MPNQTIVRPPTAVRSDGSNGVVQRRVVTVFLVLLAALLAAASARGPIAAILAIFLAVLISMVAGFGRERVAFLAMMAAFATAPMNRGLSPGGPSNPITPTDLLFGLAVMLLLAWHPGAS